MWYQDFRVITAALEDTLADLAAKGASEQVLNRVRTSPPELMGHYINNLMKNPMLSEYDLTTEAIKAKDKQQTWGVIPPTRFEQSIAQLYLPQFQAWPLVYLKKLRGQQLGIENFVYHGFDGLTPQDQLWNVQTTFQQIADWARYSVQENPYFQLAAYDFSQAMSKSNEWHNFMAGQGSEEHYTPYARDEDGKINDERVVFTYPDGWHISQVTDAGDLRVEGNRMNHCVGGYCHSVNSGSSRIFSLRDPRNHPKVTIEMDGDSNTIRQIKANSDAMPEEELRLRLAEWFAELSDVQFHSADYQWEGPEWSNVSDPDDIRSSIYEEAYGKDSYDDEDYSGDIHEDYGIGGHNNSRNVEDLDVPDLLESVHTAMVEGSRGRESGFDQCRGSQHYHEDEIAETLASVIVDHDNNIMEKLIKEKPRIVLNPITGGYEPDSVIAKLGIFDIADKFYETQQTAYNELDLSHLPMNHDGKVDEKDLAGEDDSFKLYHMTMSYVMQNMNPEMQQMYHQLTGHNLLNDLDAAVGGSLQSLWTKQMQERVQPPLMKHKEDYTYHSYPKDEAGNLDESVFDESGWKYAKRFKGWYKCIDNTV